MQTTRPLFIPVVLGTVRKGRASEHVARFVHGELRQHAAIETALIDLRGLPLPSDDAGEAIKDAGFSATCQRADGLVLVVPWLESTRIETTLGTDTSLCVYVAGSFEPNEFAFLRRTLRPGMTFVDSSGRIAVLAVLPLQPALSGTDEGPLPVR